MNYNATPNNRMQPDQNARYALILATHPGREAVGLTRSRYSGSETYGSQKTKDS